MDILDIDKKHIFHPYTSMLKPDKTYFVEYAEGVNLHLSNGKIVIDAMASWWSAIHGYSHPTLNHAAKSQIEKFSHVMFGGLTHQPAVELCVSLLDLTHENLDCVFYSDSGSVSVEVAIKMALQYWVSQNQVQKKYLLTVKSGYHGDTLGTMMLCDPENGMHRYFPKQKNNIIFCESPSPKFDQDWDESSLDDLTTLVNNRNTEIAAIILEPIVQNAGGLKFYHPEYLRQLRLLCDKYHILLIFDEIATGFGRTGKLFAYEHANVCPDILCLGKSLTGGYISLGATLCTREVATGLSGHGEVPFMHGPTFMGNPLACAIANSNIKLLQSYDWVSSVMLIQDRIEAGLCEYISMDCIADIRVLGAIGVVEFCCPINMEKIQNYLVNRGVWVRPYRNLIYITPPYICSKDEIDKITKEIGNVIKEGIFRK